MAWINTKTAVVIGAALIVATGISVVVVKESHAPKIIPSAFAGLPQTLDELNAWYVEPPTGQNAATFELQGIHALQLAGDEKIPHLPILGNAPAPLPSAPLSPAMKSALAAFLQDNHDALHFFDQGAQYDQSRYPINLTTGPEIPLPYLSRIKAGTMLEEIAAISDAENHDGRRAADDVLAGLGLARSLEAEPELISQLVRTVGVYFSVAGLEQVFNRTTVPSESLDQLANAFQSMEAYEAKGEGFNRAMAGEKVNDLALLKDRAALLQVFSTNDLGLVDAEVWGLDAEQHHQMIEYLNRTPYLKDEQDYFETTFEEVMSARQETFPDRLQDVKDVISQRVAKARSRGLLFNATIWVQHRTGREAQCLASLRLAMTAIALEQFRAAHGNQYPATLAALTPVYLTTAPLDPYDGKPLRYRKQGAGYLLYSIGPYLKDYGGRTKMFGRGNIPFSVIKPPPY